MSGPRAFVTGPCACAVAEPGTSSTQPKLQLLCLSLPGTFITGVESIRAIREACDYALGEVPSITDPIPYSDETDTRRRTLIKDTRKR